MTTSGTPESAVFPLVRTCPFEPPTEYPKLLDGRPMTRVRLRDGRQAWVAARHEDVCAVLNDPRFSANRQHPDFPLQVTAGAALRKPDAQKSMLSMDGVEHSEARRAMLSEFSARRIKLIRPLIQVIVDERLDAMVSNGKSADLVEALALPVPSLVICELLGVPYRDHEFFETNTARMLSHGSKHDERSESFGAIMGYLAKLIAGHELAPTDAGLIGRQIMKLREEGTYRQSALAANVYLLLLAGHETTANMISLGALTLLAYPDQLAIIKADPSRTPEAVEELLRFLTIIDATTARLCVEDADIGGVTIRAGEGVLALGHAANRDPRVFDHPDRFDIDRGARRHVAFGFGPHQCLGQSLARVELEIVFDRLFKRIPSLRLDCAVEDLSFKTEATIFGVHRLPVTW